MEKMLEPTLYVIGWHDPTQVAVTAGLKTHRDESP